MSNSQFALKYLLPFFVFLLVPFSIVDKTFIFVVLFLFILLILCLPRIYVFIDRKSKLEIGNSSMYSKYIHRIEFLKEDGVLKEYYSVLHGGFSGNNHRFWIFKLSTFLIGLFLIGAILVLNILGPLFPELISSLGFKLLLLVLLLTPTIFIFIHLIEIDHKYVLFFGLVYSLVFYLLLVSSYLLFFAYFLHLIFRFFLRIIKGVLLRMG